MEILGLWKFKKEKSSWHKFLFVNNDIWWHDHFSHVTGVNFDIQKLIFDDAATKWKNDLVKVSATISYLEP